MVTFSSLPNESINILKLSSFKWGTRTPPYRVAKQIINLNDISSIYYYSNNRISRLDISTLCLGTEKHFFQWQEWQIAKNTMQEREKFYIGKYGIDYSIYNIYKHEKWYTSEYKRKIISRLLNWWQEFFKSFEVFMNFENFCQDFLAVSIFFRCTPKYSWNKNIYIFGIRITLFRLPVRTGSRFGAVLTFIWSKWIHRIKIWFLSFRTNLSILFQ